MLAWQEDYQSVDSDYFDDYSTRMARYRLNTLYFENTQYHTSHRLHYPARYVGRYRHMRGIYNFVSRLVDLEVNKTYGGRIDWAGDLRTGAIPIIVAKGASPQLLESIKTLLEWSNFGDGKDLYVRNGARLGDSFLKVVTVIEELVTQIPNQDPVTTLIPKKVRIEVLDPHKVYDVGHDNVGNVNHIIIQYYDTDIDPNTGKERDFKFVEEWDKQVVSKWIEYGNATFEQMRKRAPNSIEDNIYGFVPVVHVPHKDIGRKFGVTSFHNSLEKVDEQNDIASLTNDGIRKSVYPMLVVKGGKMPDPNQTVRDRDGFLVFELTKPDQDVVPITPTIDMAGSLATQDKMTSEIEGDVPPLSLQRIREKGGDPSGVAIENAYSDAANSLEAIQGRYDERLIRALQMACTMAGVLGLEGFPYTLESYKQGLLRFYIKERRVFSDRMDPVERARLIMEAAASDAWEIVARDLEVPQEDIALMMERRTEREAAQIAAATRAAMEGVGMDDDEDEEDDEDTAEEDINAEAPQEG